MKPLGVCLCVYTRIGLLVVVNHCQWWWCCSTGVGEAAEDEQGAVGGGGRTRGAAGRRRGPEGHVGAERRAVRSRVAGPKVGHVRQLSCRAVNSPVGWEKGGRGAEEGPRASARASISSKLEMYESRYRHLPTCRRCRRQRLVGN